jgi:hypothetical protein
VWLVPVWLVPVWPVAEVPDPVLPVPESPVLPDPLLPVLPDPVLPVPVLAVPVGTDVLGAAGAASNGESGRLRWCLPAEPEAAHELVTTAAVTSTAASRHPGRRVEVAIAAVSRLTGPAPRSDPSLQAPHIDTSRPLGVPRPVSRRQPRIGTPAGKGAPVPEPGAPGPEG